MKNTTSYTRFFMTAGIIFLTFLLIQIIPYGRSHTNPPIVQEPDWDSSQTKELARQACFDCHSNETQWPWYASVAPASWLLQRDVDEARQWMNFSDWQGMKADFMIKAIEDGRMPPLQYKLLHPDARLTEAEKSQLIEGIKNTLE